MMGDSVMATACLTASTFVRSSATRMRRLRRVVPSNDPNASEVVSIADRLAGFRSVVGVLTVLVLPREHPASDERQDPAEDEHEGDGRPRIVSLLLSLIAHALKVAGRLRCPIADRSVRQVDYEPNRPSAPDMRIRRPPTIPTVHPTITASF